MSEAKAITDVEGVLLGILKLTNEAGGRADVRRLDARPPDSYTGQAWRLARERGLMSATGAITPAGYRWLGEGLQEGER
jgi:hypothetical protein